MTQYYILKEVLTVSNVIYCYVIERYGSFSAHLLMYHLVILSKPLQDCNAFAGLLYYTLNVSSRGS